MWSGHPLALAAVVAGLVAAAWPGAGRAFANVEVGEKVERVVLPTIDGGEHELLSRSARANVFVFFRPRQDHSERTLAAMAECEREFAAKPVHWVAVVSGAAPRDEVVELAARSGIRMPVLVDEGDRLYGALGVRLHPSIGIADGDGKLLAYQPFQKLNYCDLVRGRIRLALGEITPEQMEAIVSPAPAPMPSEVKGAVANRHVKLGRMFLRTRNWGKAEEQAREAIAKDPSFAPAHAFLGEVLAGQGNCAAARKAFAEALRLDPANAAAAEGRRACGAR
jgi:tetratricopeptide (TPR) repeat protein